MSLFALHGVGHVNIHFKYGMGIAESGGEWREVGVIQELRSAGHIYGFHWQLGSIKGLIANSSIGCFASQLCSSPEMAKMSSKIEGS